MSARTYTFPLCALSDVDLRRAVAAKDEDAIVRGYWRLPHILSAKYRAPGLTREDLEQEARIGLVGAVRDFSGYGRFESFAYMCAEREVMDAVTKANRQKHRPLNEAADLHGVGNAGDARPFADVLPGAPSPERIVVDREHVREVFRTIAEELTEIERFALVKVTATQGSRGPGDVSYDDAARMFGTSKKAIDNARHRAKKKVALVA